MIQLHNIHKSYHLGGNTQQVLKDVNIRVASGEMVAIMGASGSGKSTLMNIIGLLDQPDTGQYILDGSDVSSLPDDERAACRNKGIGFVFQSFFLLPRMTALQNVCLPLQYRDMREDEMRVRAEAVLAKVGMGGELASHRPNQLSGGQQQRVAIARALVVAPAIVLADEPTGALDSKTGQEIMNLFTQLNREELATIVIVTHDPKVSAQCQRTIDIVDGRILP
ncbi:MAG: ABC transporter ATP-binding protein [Gammaproteobacteria bacterium]